MSFLNAPTLASHGRGCEAVGKHDSGIDQWAVNLTRLVRDVE